MQLVIECPHLCTMERHRKRWQPMNRKTGPENLCNCQKLPLHFPASTLWDLHASSLLPKLLHQLVVDGHKVSHKKAQVWTVDCEEVMGTRVGPH